MPSRVGLSPFAPRTSPVLGQRPARRHRRCRSCQEDLDTLRAGAVAAGDVRSAFLLMGIRDGSSTAVKEPITVPNKEKDMETNPEIIDRLTNALQSALMLAARLEPDLRQAARDAAQLVEAVSKAAAAAHELRPNGNKRG